MKNLATTFLFVAIYGTYVSTVFSNVNQNWFYFINFILVPIALGATSYVCLRGETWLRIVLVAFIPVLPIAYLGNFAETDDYTIRFLLPLILTFAIGGVMAAILSKLIKH